MVASRRATIAVKSTMQNVCHCPQSMLIVSWPFQKCLKAYRPTVINNHTFMHKSGPVLCNIRGIELLKKRFQIMYWKLLWRTRCSICCTVTKVIGLSIGTGDWLVVQQIDSMAFNTYIEGTYHEGTFKELMLGSKSPVLQNALDALGCAHLYNFQLFLCSFSAKILPNFVAKLSGEY